MNGLESLALHTAEIVDCRMLQLEFEFYQLNATCLRCLSDRLLNKINQWFGNTCYIEWEEDNRRRSFEKLLKHNSTKKHVGLWSFSGDVVSSVVYDHPSFKKYQQWWEKDIIFGLKADLWSSIDYLSVFDSCVPESDDPEQIKKGLLRLFNREGLFKKNYWRNHDFWGQIFYVPYKNRGDLYRGTFNISVSNFCLGKKCVTLAEEFAAFLAELSREFQNVSGHVMLSPIGRPAVSGSGHTVYFSIHSLGNQPFPCPAGVTEDEWRNAYYLYGAEWFNLLSPVQANRLHRPHANVLDRNKPIVDQMENGAIIVKSHKDILHTDIPELTQVKDLLRPLLYPGFREFEIAPFLHPHETNAKWGPRLMLELVPMSPEDIEVTDEYVIFRHKSSVK